MPYRRIDYPHVQSQKEDLTPGFVLPRMQYITYNDNGTISTG